MVGPLRRVAGQRAGTRRRFASTGRVRWRRRRRDMNEADVLDVGRQAIFTLVMTILPVMGVALVVGLVISLFQALTQIQEMTLAFVPKILVIFVSLIFLLPFMLATLSGFVETVLVDHIVAG